MRHLSDAVRDWPAGTLFVLTDSTDWEICAFRSTPSREVPDLIAAKMGLHHADRPGARPHRSHRRGLPDLLPCPQLPGR